MNKKIRYLILILVLVLLVFLILIGRKLIIIENLKGSINKYISSNNYYVKSSNYNSSNGSITNIETYNKNDIQLVKYTNLSTDNPTEMIVYHNGDTTNSYIDVGGEKTAKLNFGELRTSISNDIYPNNFYQDIIMAMFSSITSEECNGKQCYKIRNIPKDITSVLPNEILYIEKDTGLEIKRINYNDLDEPENYISTNFEYQFNTITDEDVKEPNINEYTV